MAFTLKTLNAFEMSQRETACEIPARSIARLLQCTVRQLDLRALEVDRWVS
jgi:hypothetical protein